MGLARGDLGEGSLGPRPPKSEEALRVFLNWRGLDPRSRGGVMRRMSQASSATSRAPLRPPVIELDQTISFIP